MGHLIGSCQYYLVALQGYADTERLLRLNDRFYEPLRLGVKRCGPEILKIFVTVEESFRFLEQHPGSVHLGIAYSDSLFQQRKSSKNLFVILDSESGSYNLCNVLPKDSPLVDELQMRTLRLLAAGLDIRIRMAYDLTARIRKVVLPIGTKRTWKQKSVADLLQIINGFLVFNFVSFTCFLAEMARNRFHHHGTMYL